MSIFFVEILHAGRAAIDMKHIKRDFNLKAWVPAPGVDLGGGAEAKNKTFSEYGHVAYQIKADNVCSYMVANILPTDTPLTQGVGSKGQTIYFYERSHVAYQIKGNGAQSTMKANMLPLHIPTKRSYFFPFLKVVMLHIKLNRKKCRPT